MFCEFATVCPSMEHINLRTQLTAPERVMLEQLGWVAEAVMPKFKLK